MQEYLAQVLPRKRKQHCAAVGTGALVVHFAYFIQEPGLLEHARFLLDDYARRA